MPVMAPPLKATFSASLRPTRGGLGGAHIGAHRNVHADIAGSAGQYGADHEADGGLGPEKNQYRDRKHGTDDADRRVLAVEIGLGAFLNRCGDSLHAVVARRLRQNPLAHDPAVGDCRHGADQCEDQSCCHNSPD
jgi:hypothetical protein